MEVIKGRVTDVKGRKFTLDTGLSYSVHSRDGDMPNIGDVLEFSIKPWTPPDGGTPVMYANLGKGGSPTNGNTMTKTFTPKPFQKSYGKSPEEQRNIARSVGVNAVFGNVNVLELSNKDVDKLLDVAGQIETWLTRTH